MTKKRQILFSAIRGLLAICIALFVAMLLIFISSDGASFGQKLRTALKDGLHGAGTFFSELLLFLAEALPTLLILAAVALAVILPLRKSLKKRRAQKAAPAPAPAAAPAEEERP